MTKNFDAIDVIVANSEKVVRVINPKMIADINQSKELLSVTTLMALVTKNRMINKNKDEIGICLQQARRET